MVLAATLRRVRTAASRAGRAAARGPRRVATARLSTATPAAATAAVKSAVATAARPLWQRVGLGAAALGAFGAAAYAGARLSSESLESRCAAAHAELMAAFGDRYSVVRDERESHGTPTNSYHFSSSLPNAVVYALSTADVQTAVQICARHRLPMIPFGSGTSLEGHTMAPYGGVCIDLSRMDSIVRLGVADMDVTVQPGITWQQLNAELKPHGLFFPVDPGPGASIGGMVATGCSGTNAVRYGTMRHNVLNLTVVLADGTVVRTAQRARKSSAGYDLTRLFVGSEGTLGIVTEATLRLTNIPEETAVAVCAFDSIRDATNAVIDITQRGVRVGCVELLDEPMVQAVNSYAGFNYALKPTLFFKFSGSKASVADDIERVGAVIAKYHPATAAPASATAKDSAKDSGSAKSGSPFQWATTPAECERLWEARKGALWAAMSLRPGAKPWTTDVCVPISRLADCIAETQADLRASFLPAPLVGHVGDGNFHVLILIDSQQPHEVAEAQRLNQRMIDRAIAMDGTCTGEHGVGLGKREYLTKELGPHTVALMKRVKSAFDPLNLLNPGKVVDLGIPHPIASAAHGSVHSDHNCEFNTPALAAAADPNAAAKAKAKAKLSSTALH